MNFKPHHVAISTHDMQETLDFYAVFGFEIAHHYKDPEGQFEITHLKLGAMFLEVFWFAKNAPAPETASELSTDLPRIGVKHFALQVDSIVEAKEFVESLGFAANVEPSKGKTGVLYFFIKDPSGILLEFVEDNRNL